MPEKIKEVLRLKVEFWIVLVTLGLAVAGTAAGVFTFVDVKEDADAAENNNNNAGRNDLQVEQRFHGKTGFVENPLLSSADARTRSGYLAVVRHVHSPSVSVLLELIDSNQRKVVHTWDLGPGRVGLVGMGHFHFLADGSVITNQGTSTFRLDACSRVVWRKRLGGHHSIERDADGNFWMPWDVAPKTVPHGGADVLEHGLIRISPDGEVLSRIALSGALTRAGHRHLLYALHERERNPFHMNDVEPVLEDGPFWRRGDLFVSLRTNSVVLLYRPATDEVVWLRAGPWLHQHDVDVIGDSEISVFSNNAVRGADGRWRVLGANEVVVYDFATGEARSPWREVMRRHDVRTGYRGQATVFGDGGLMVAENHYGRVLMLSAGGEPVWSYINQASDESDGWGPPVLRVRWLDAEYGAQVARSAAARDCGPAAD